MLAERPAVWTVWQRRLHWWTAALVLLAFPLGWLMVAIPLRELLLKFALYQLHKTLGITVLLFTLLRLLRRATTGRPLWDVALPVWQHRAAAIMHGLLYALLLVVPLLGYATAATAPARVPTLFLGVLPIPHVFAASDAAFAVLRQLHRWAAILLIALACGHLTAAVHNHRRGLPSLRRMWRGGCHPASPSRGRTGR